MRSISGMKGARSLGGAMALVASLLVLLPLLPASAGSLDVPGPGMRPQLSEGFQRDLERKAAGELYGAFLHFAPGSTRVKRRVFVTRAGLKLVRSFDQISVVFATGPLGNFAELRDSSELEYIEDNRRVELFGDTAPWATRVRIAQESIGAGPYRDPSGAVLDGAGVGVAIVDSGVDATHPDLSGRVAKNFKVVCSTPGARSTDTNKCFGPYEVVEDPYADATSGHGTHVAGIVAGEGSASDGTFKGVAPGVSLFGFGTGEADRIFSYTEAFQYILDNLETLNPRIRVINNSWGDPGGTSFSPGTVVNKLTDQLVQRGVSVVWAAGNGGGSGTADATSSFSKNPTPGVVSVANYNDGGTGTRDGNLLVSSSRGREGAPETYPDISAPGSSIISTCRPSMPLCDLGPTIPWSPNYASMSGTSMAAPHISGIAAILYQARPELTPAQVEDTLQDTAYKFGIGYRADIQNVGGTTSFDKGAGLVDVPAALDALFVAHDGEAGSPPHIIAEDPAGDAPAFGANDILSVSVVEEELGLRYTLGLADATDLGPDTLYYLAQIVDGRAYRTSLALSAEGPSASAPHNTTNTLLATDLALEGDDLSFLLPFAGMGDPKPGAPVYRLWASSYQRVALDTAPGGGGASRDLQPEYGRAFTIARRSAVDPTPTLTPTLTPAARRTRLDFAAGQPGAGDYGDMATFTAVLKDGAGSPIADKDVFFELRGADGIRSASGRSDAAGVAEVDLVLDVPPDGYSVTVSYAGEAGSLEPSDAQTTFRVLHEETAATLTINGKAGEQRLDMTLIDNDQVVTPVPDAYVVFLADGKQIGSTMTDDGGLASMPVPPKYRGGNHRFEVVYDGDRYHAPTSATARS